MSRAGRAARLACDNECGGRRTLQIDGWHVCRFCSLLFQGERTMRWTTVAALVALASAAVWADEGKVRAFKFSKDDVGKVPSGWKVEKTGKGEGSEWKVVEDDTAPSKSGAALAQTAKSPGGVFNICVAEDTKYKD